MKFPAADLPKIIRLKEPETVHGVFIVTQWIKPGKGVFENTLAINLIKR